MKTLDVASTYTPAVAPSSQRSASMTKRDNTLSTNGSNIMRKTDLVVSNKRLFSNFGGLGAGRVGSEEWVRAKEKHDRIASYVQSSG